MTLDNLPDAGELDGTELVPVLQNGIWCKAQLARVLALPTPTFASNPTSFVATVISDTQIDLTWSGSGTNYILQRNRENDGAWATIYSGATASFDDTGLYQAEHYYYRVKAQGSGVFDSDWVFVDATTDAPV